MTPHACLWAGLPVAQPAAAAVIAESTRLLRLNGGGGRQHRATLRPPSIGGQNIM